MFPQFDSQHGIETDRGFVEYEQVRITDERARERHASELPTGQRVGAGAGVASEPDCLDRLVDGGARSAVEGGEVGDIVGDGQVRVDARRLGDVPDATAEFDCPGGETEHGHRAGFDDLPAHDRAHERGLATTRRAEQPGDRAARDLERDLVEGEMGTAANAKIVHIHGEGVRWSIHRDSIHRALKYALRLLSAVM